jgi:hypothetical protein
MPCVDVQYNGGWDNVEKPKRTSYKGILITKFMDVTYPFFEIKYFQLVKAVSFTEFKKYR